VITLKLL